MVKYKELLIRTIKSMPQDFALSTAKQYLVVALDEINHVENKRNRRDAQNAQAAIKNQSHSPNDLAGNQWQFKDGVFQHPDAGNVINQINDLIQDEKNKLDAIGNNADTSDELFND